MSNFTSKERLEPLMNDRDKDGVETSRFKSEQQVNGQVEKGQKLVAIE